jgi:hypothetical protein
MSAKSCVECGGPLPIQSGRGRRRVRCETCAPSRNQKQPKTFTLMPAPTSGDGLVAATLAELERADMASSSLGQAALVLARRIEADLDNGSAMASMVKQWQDTMGRATAGAEPQAVSLTDQLKARRDARRHA